MPEPACRWNLALGLDQRGRVASDHDRIIGQMRDLAGAMGRYQPLHACSVHT